MKFNFKAKDKVGQIKEGAIEATSADAAIATLQKNDLFPIRVTAEQEKSELTKTFLKYYDRVTAKELVVFFRQLAVLIEARVPIVSSLIAINEQTSNKYFNKVLAEIVDDIEDGLPFSNALEKHKDVFVPLTVNIIRQAKLRET